MMLSSWSFRQLTVGLSELMNLISLNEQFSFILKKL
jgi:hypothetical protein